MKIENGTRIETKEEYISAGIQKMAFEAGFTWLDGTKDIKNEHMAYLFFRDGIMVCSASCYYPEFKEISLSDSELDQIKNEFAEVYGFSDPENLGEFGDLITQIDCSGDKFDMIETIENAMEAKDKPNFNDECFRHIANEVLDLDIEEGSIHSDLISSIVFVSQKIVLNKIAKGLNKKMGGQLDVDELVRSIIFSSDESIDIEELAGKTLL